MHFSKQLIWNLEETFAKLHWTNWQFYLWSRTKSESIGISNFASLISDNIQFSRSTLLPKSHDLTGSFVCIQPLTHWGRVIHICVGNLVIIGSDNGLSPRRRQAIIWTNVGILLIRPLGTNFSEILIRNQTFSFKKIHLKMLFAKWHPSCLGLNVLMKWKCCPSHCPINTGNSNAC